MNIKEYWVEVSNRIGDIVWDGDVEIDEERCIENDVSPMFLAGEIGIDRAVQLELVEYEDAYCARVSVPDVRTKSR